MRTITLKQVPDELYERLKASAEANRRSMNSEALFTLERGLGTKVPPDRSEQLARIRHLRESISGEFGPEEIRRWIDEGRR